MKTAGYIILILAFMASVTAFAEEENKTAVPEQEVATDKAQAETPDTTKTDEENKEDEKTEEKASDEPKEETTEATAINEATTPAEEPKSEQNETIIEESAQVEQAETLEVEVDAEESGGDVKPIEPPQTCKEKCMSACSCWFELGGGGGFFMLLVNDYKSPYGNHSGVGFWGGGRAFGYLGKTNAWRLGMMSAGGVAETDETVLFSNKIGFAGSSKRTVSGGYGGFTAEYILRPHKRVEFPLGFMVGFGGQKFSSTMIQANKNEDGTNISQSFEGIETTYSTEGSFFAFQPMIGFEVSITNYLKLGTSVVYLLTEPFSGGQYNDGFAFTFGLFFGNFFAKEFPME